MKKYTIIFLIFSINCLGQDVNFSETNYKTGEISFSNFKKVKMTSIEILKDSIRYVNLDILKNQTTAFTDINYLKLQEGTNINKGLLYGSLFTTSSVISTVISRSKDKNKVFIEKPLQKSLLFIMGGTILGGFFGAATPRFKTYYFGNQKLSSLLIYPNLQFVDKNVGLGVNIKF